MVVRARTGALLVVVAALLTGACGAFETSGYQFVRSPGTGTYLKVPEDWQVFDRDEIDDAMAKAGNGQADEFAFLSVFDAAERPSVFFDPAGETPKGVIRVRELRPEERDQVSFATVREEVFQELNDSVAAGDWSVLDVAEVESGPARGQRVVFAGAAEVDGTRYVVAQVSLVDLDANRLHFVAVACSVACYERNKDEIDEVVESLTIKER